MEIFGTDITTAFMWVLGIAHCAVFLLIIDPTIRQAGNYIWLMLYSKLR